jgi:hypothetical protein
MPLALAEHEAALAQQPGEFVAARGLAQENSPDRRATLLAQGGGKAHSVLG